MFYCLWYCERKEKNTKKNSYYDENANILAAVQLNLMISTKQLKRECELSRRSILRILHENKFHPYHIHLYRNLEELDIAMNFYIIFNIMLRMINEDPTFLSRVLFSDEANFCNGQVNRHMHYWAVENPYWMQTVPFQYSCLNDVSK